MDSHARRQIAAGMVGLGMIFDETYRPFFEAAARCPLYSPETGPVTVSLAAAASRTGSRAARYLAQPNPPLGRFQNFAGPDAVARLIAADVNAVCIASPDDRHFAAARDALAAGKHVLVEKPSVLALAELDELTALAERKGV